jgi:hypothetical protein
MRLRIVLFILLAPAATKSQTPDYREIFGDDWVKAEQYVGANRSWMEHVLEKNHIPFQLGIAVIFPEIVRYSALRDQMEITLLKALFINLGEEYANFSIGHFQMKPSFAMYIREHAGIFMNTGWVADHPDSSSYNNIRDYRRSVVADLEDPVKEFGYLAAFFTICKSRYSTDDMEEYQKLKFLATAYNTGIEKSAREIEAMAEAKYFNTKLFKSENYSYADVSLFWYNMQKTGGGKDQ